MKQQKSTIYQLSRSLFTGLMLLAVLISALGLPQSARATNYYALDEFKSQAYNNQDGSVNWAANWAEINDTGGATGGNVQVVADTYSGYRLRINSRVVTNDTDFEGISRAIDLSPATTATLSFSFAQATDNNGFTYLESADQLAIQVSTNGSTWNTIDTLSGSTTTTGDRVYDITGYRNASSAIQFIIIGGFDQANESIFLDNVKVTYNTSNTHTSNSVLPYVQTYYLPVPEDQILQVLNAISPAAESPTFVHVSITIIADETVIYFDHWEDGFEPEINNPAQSTSEIWGDNNTVNGMPPGYTTDILYAGDIIVLKNPVNTSQLNVIDFDGGDKLASNEAIAITRASWASVTGTLHGGAEELLDTSRWGTTFDVPVPQSVTDFEYTGVAVMALQDDTNIYLNGSSTPTATIAEGESYLFNDTVNVGDAITSSAPVQATLMAGDIGSTYELDFFTLYPREFLSYSYYAVVPSFADGSAGGLDPVATAIFLFNPNTSDITVNWETNASSGAISVTQRSWARWNMPTTATAAHFYTGTTTTPGLDFEALSVTDAGYRNYDWGYTLIPQNELTQQAKVGWGPGQDPTITPPTQNGSPIWITAVGPGNPIYVCVDYDGDNTAGTADSNGYFYDVRLSVAPLSMNKIYDPDGDQTGMLLYLCNGSQDNNDNKLAVAWGQDPTTASYNVPGLDVGTTVPPLPNFTAVKGAELTTDINADGNFDVGETFEYQIRVSNTGALPVPASSIDVQDIIPPYTLYVPGSTEIYYSGDSRPTSPSTTSIPDQSAPPAETTFPLDDEDEDGVGYVINQQLWIESYFIVRFKVKINASLPGETRIRNEAKISGLTLNYDPEVEIIVQPPDETSLIGDTIYQDWNGNGVQDPGEPGIQGVTVELRDGSCTPNVDCLTDVTDFDGIYGFPNLLTPVSYTVAVIQASLPGGLTLTGDPDSTKDGQHTVTLTDSNKPYTIADFGYQGNASIGDFVWFDANKDGLQTGESGIFGVRVYVDTNGNGTYDSGEPSAVTDANGYYTISKLVPGTYTVRLDTNTIPTDYFLTTANIPLSVTLIAGQVYTTADFGLGYEVSKPLYLSDPGQGMDRIDPVATGDSTTSTVSSGLGNEVITLVASGSKSDCARTVTTCTFAYNSGTTGSNRMLVVGISYRNNDSELVSTVTYGGQAMTQVGTRNNGTNGRMYIYRLLNPPTGSNNLVVTWSSALNNGAVIGAVTYSGVNQTIPTGAFASATGNSTTPTVAAVTSASGELVFGVVAGRTTSDFAVTGGGTPLWSARPYSGQTSGSGQSKTGAASVPLSWSGSSAQWVAGGVSLKPAPVSGSATVTFTQTAAMLSNFHLPIGRTVTARSYINVTSGALPAAPGITAVLKNNGTTFITLSNPTLTLISGSVYRLDWSGTLSSAVTVLSGNKISMDIVTSVGGYTFELLYDSSTYPSQVKFPSDTIINVDSLATYNAAYAGGSVITESGGGVTVYIRTVISDPFGPSDISSTSLKIQSACGGADTNVTLDPTYLVDTSGATKTYEYAWTTPTSCQGNYNITIKTYEGTEGIYATRTAAFTEAATISNFVWNDRDGDGVQDVGETGISGATVRLLDSSGNTVLQTTNTNPSGAYSFTGLPAGSYIVEFVTPSGYAHSPQDQGDNTKDSDASVSTNRTGTVTLTAGQIDDTVDAGFYQNATLGNYVWLDRDLSGTGSHNGLQNTADEPGIRGVKVNLLNSAGTSVLQTTTTDKNGAYSFSVAPGTYIVEFILPGVSSVTPDQGDDALDSDAAVVTGRTGTITLTSGQTDNTVDAGFYTLRLDLGDLPDTGLLSSLYHTLFSPGPAHVVFPDNENNVTHAPGADYLPETTNGAPAVWLGYQVDTESNGISSPAAVGDDSAGIDDEDGFWFIDTSGWKPTGDPLQDVHGDVRLVVNSSAPIKLPKQAYWGLWIDWNQDGFQNNPYEFYSGSTETSSPTPVTLNITMPANYQANTSVYIRVRAADQPLGFDNFDGTIFNGEVEDNWYKFDGTGGLTPVTLSYFVSQRSGETVSFSWSTATETGNVGFNLYVADGEQKTLINPQMIPSLVIDSLDMQNYSYSAPVKGTTFYIEDVSVLGETELHGPYQLGKAYGSQLSAEKIDLAAIQTENEKKDDQRQDQITEYMVVPAAALAPAVVETAQPAIHTRLLPDRLIRPTSTPRPRNTPKATATLKATGTKKFTVTPRVTATPVVTASPTNTNVPSATLTVVPSATMEPTATTEPSSTVESETVVAPSETALPTETVEPTATTLPTETETAQPTSTPLLTETETPMPTATRWVEPVETFTPTSTFLPSETATPGATATTEVTEVPATAVPYDPANLQLTTTFNFKVDKTGIYRVTYEMLQTAGLDLAGVPVEKLTVLNRDKMIPIYVSMPAQVETFGAGGYLEFYGEALDTLYTDTNVYTLQVYASATPRIQTDNSPFVSGEAIPVSYTEAFVMHRQRSYAYSSAIGDGWYDTSMLVYTTPNTWSYPFSIDSLADTNAPALLELVVWGVTDWPQSPDHHLQVSLNGVALANQTFDGLIYKTIKVELPAGTLKPGANTLELTLPGDTGVQFDLVYLDKFTINYQRYVMAQDGRLSFNGTGPAFSVANLPNANVEGYRLSASGQNRLGQVQTQASGTTYTATFAGSAQNAKYLVVTTDKLYTPVLEATRAKVDLNIPAEYLVIVHPDFITGIQPLVQARQAQGLTVNVVNVQDVYAQYTYGNFDPQAIKQYIAYAYKNLGTRYVLLVGGDTYDYRNYLGKNSISFIPSMYAETGTNGAKIPVDPMYADVNGDNVPDLAIGRFPVRTSTDLSTLASKTLAYGSKNYGRTAFFASDVNDGQVSFKSDSLALMAQLPGGWTVDSAHLDDLSVADARTKLLAAMNAGTGLVVFNGHSGPTSWTFNNLFNTTNAAALTNAGKPFVVMQWGCWNTYYVNPTSQYLVQSFLFSGDKGAAAVFGAIGLADSTSEELLGELLIPRLATPGMTLGEALQQSKAELAKTHPELLDVLLGWTLMGDPALVIQP